MGKHSLINRMFAEGDAAGDGSVFGCKLKVERLLRSCMEDWQYFLKS
jgi:hypothetical protein